MKTKSPTTLTMSAAASARAMMTKKIGTHDPLRCFSIVLWKPEHVQGGPNDNVMASGAASLGLATIDLELPQEGNGRSVREWCEAIYAAAREHGGGKDDDDDDDEQDEQRMPASGTASTWRFRRMPLAGDIFAPRRPSPRRAGRNQRS